MTYPDKSYALLSQVGETGNTAMLMTCISDTRNTLAVLDVLTGETNISPYWWPLSVDKLSRSNGQTTHSQSERSLPVEDMNGLSVGCDRCTQDSIQIGIADHGGPCSSRHTAPSCVHSQLSRVCCSHC